ncbi:hypothetical protein FSP39_017116 [Pinctada imbricata]|uniref:Uncharacterized protein n=1 Tax=Pinctada imbricata TaxID=66713 RepID=A0AA88YXG8_PINIB|nr:hypothetical protein FSP39_017116 [Pinctada imbricata]
MTLDNSNSDGARVSSRKLFDKDSDRQIEDFVEDSNIIPASPTRNVKPGVKLATPVIKIKRLTQEEILLYSPSRKAALTDEQIAAESMSKSEDDASEHSIHEHDDFSDVKPLDEEKANNETELPNSQGFETGEEMETVKTTCSSSAPVDSCHQQNENSEVLFTQADSEMESEPYDPDLASTFRSKSAAKNTQVFTTDNLKSSQSSESSASSGSQVITEEKEKESTQQTYNPSLEQTMASDTPRRGRKRKQETPKKLSPESTRPKRSRKSKDVASSQESQAENTAKKLRNGKREKLVAKRKDGTPLKNKASY